VAAKKKGKTAIKKKAARKPAAKPAKSKPPKKSAPKFAMAAPPPPRPGGSASIGRTSPTEILKKATIAKFGWVPDLPDYRDQMYKAVPIVAAPPKVDLSPQCPPVYNQGQLGSCTGNAIAAAIQFDRMKQDCADGAQTPSRLFIYYNERVMEQTVDQDPGAQIRDGIKSVNKLGVCFEGDGADQWAYVEGRFANQPPQACYDSGAKNRVLSYDRLTNTLDQLKNCLASGYPFVFGFTVYDAFEGQDVMASGELNMPQPGEGRVGGHAVMAVGYDDAAQRFLIRNSWGPDWGKAGYFTMPYEYLTTNSLADDFWTIRIVQQP
jgi:C1A family cysteine protease